MYYISRIAGLISVGVLAAAGWFAVRLARADALFRERTPESVARASDAMPWNTEYLAFRALQVEYGGGDSTPLLERMISLTPLASAPRIRLGLAAEVRGDFDGAQKWLLDAARVDHEFEPRWSLANYFFRRADRGEFFKWMRLALEVSYGDRTPAFDLCWRMSGDPQEIARAIPDRHDVVSAYLAYLLSSKRLAAALPVALQLAAAADRADSSLLLGACDAFLDARDAAASRACWRAIGYQLAEGAVERGFHWRTIEVPGVSHIALDVPDARRVSLSGRQPESAELMRKVFDLRPGARCVLQWEALTRGLGDDSGLEWRISGQRARLPSDENWRTGELVFTARGELQDLVLAYQRPAGQPRAEGSIEIRGVSVTETK